MISQRAYDLEERIRIVEEMVADAIQRLDRLEDKLSVMGVFD